MLGRSMSHPHRGLVSVALVGFCAAVLLGGTALASPPPPTPHVWLHYDFLVFPDGHSDAPDPAAIQKVVDVYAAHGIQLEIDNQHTAIPTSNPVLSLGPAINDSGCPGALGIDSLEAQYFHPTANHEWHYAIFGDKVADPAGSCTTGGSGWAELNGDHFIVSMDAARLWGRSASQPEAVFFMHELGHNLGLRHGGNEDTNNKPNYLSVMNYSFDPLGIPYAAMPGSTTFAGYRLDYSESTLPTLDLSHLNETVGIQAGTTDITLFKLGVDPSYPGYFAAGEGPATGPIDWNRDGTTGTDVSVNLVAPNPIPVFLPEFLTGFDDWAEVRAYILGTIAHGPKTIAHEDAAQQPVVSAISPVNGPASGGTQVTITGSHLGKATQVLFGTDPASFTILNQQTIVAVSPTVLSPLGGTVDVTVVSGTNPSPAVSADLFTYAPWQVPVVQSISPSAGPAAGGTVVTITGSHLAGTTAVTFDFRYPATSFSVIDDNTIRAVTPFLGGNPNAPVTVSNPAGDGLGCCFQYVAAPSAVQSVSPATGFEIGGTNVTLVVPGLWTLGGPITGVSFGATPAASFQVVDLFSGTVTAISPPGVGTVEVTVTDAGGTSPNSPSDVFRYLPTPPRPTVSSVSPTSGPAGTPVTVHGSGFTAATGVCFGTQCVAAWTAVDDNSIIVAAPSSAAPQGSTVDVTVSSPGGTSTTGPADLFTLL
jgi:hypothetical protein